MDEKRIIELALEAHLLNYIDNETPRRYFVCGNADLEDVKDFARLVVEERAKEIELMYEVLRYYACDGKYSDFVGKCAVTK